MLELGNAYDEMGHHIEVAYHLDGQYLPKHGEDGFSSKHQGIRCGLHYYPNRDSISPQGHGEFF